MDPKPAEDPLLHSTDACDNCATNCATNCSNCLNCPEGCPESPRGSGPIVGTSFITAQSLSPTHSNDSQEGSARSTFEQFQRPHDVPFPLSARGRVASFSEAIGGALSHMRRSITGELEAEEAGEAETEAEEKAETEDEAEEEAEAEAETEPQTEGTATKTPASRRKLFRRSLFGFGTRGESQPELPSQQEAKDSLWQFETLEDIELIGYAPSTKRRLMTPELASEIREKLPPLLRLHSTWHLCYSLEQHGASLHTLYDRCKEPVKNATTGYVICVSDRLGTVFGGFCNERFHVAESRRYYGNSTCFLWRYKKLPQSVAQDGSTRPSLDGNYRFQAFMYGGNHSNSTKSHIPLCVFSTASYLSMGTGGGAYGLWMDDRLEKGVSQRCETFGNEPLSDAGEKFDIINVEVWRVN